MTHPGGEAKRLCCGKRIFLFRLIKFEQKLGLSNAWSAGSKNYLHGQTHWHALLKWFFPADWIKFLPAGIVPAQTFPPLID
jgi:hypothetical protein